MQKTNSEGEKRKINQSRCCPVMICFITILENHCATIETATQRVKMRVIEKELRLPKYCHAINIYILQLNFPEDWMYHESDSWKKKYLQVNCLHFHIYIYIYNEVGKGD